MYAEKKNKDISEFQLQVFRGKGEQPVPQLSEMQN